MTVIVASHMGVSPLPTPPVDIPFSHLKAAAAATTTPVGLSVDPSVPRVVLAHSIVAAAAALPTLTPALPSHEPEYRLASKRKSPDDDVLENTDSSKRVRTEDDSLFGPLSPPQPPPTPPPVIPTSNDVLSYTLEQAIVAILSTPTEPTPQATPPPVTAAASPVNAAGPSRLPSSPLASCSILPTFEETETPTPIIIQRPLRSPQPPRPTEPPIWKVACRSRVDRVIESYGASYIRATVAQEASRILERSLLSRSTSSRFAMEAAASPCSASDLQVEIYTDSDFEDDVDMSFDLDDSDVESEEDEAEDEASPHERVVDLPVVDQPMLEDTPRQGSRSSPPPPPSPSYPPSPISIPAPISIPTIPPMMMPPPLPRLASIPVYCLRTYPELPRLGTPPEVKECGQLTRAFLEAQKAPPSRPFM